MSRDIDKKWDGVIFEMTEDGTMQDFLNKTVELGVLRVTRRDESVATPGCRAYQVVPEEEWPQNDIWELLRREIRFFTEDSLRDFTTENSRRG